MTVPEHGLALSDAAIDVLHWLNNNNGPSRDVLNTHTMVYVHYNNNGHIPYSYYWMTRPIDVRGLPNISLTLVCTSGDQEAVLKVLFQVSLDSVDWIDIPESMFTIGDGQALVTSVLQSLFATLFLRTNFLRVLVTFPDASPPDLPEVELHGHIVAGEA